MSLWGFVPQPGHPGLTFYCTKEWEAAPPEGLVPTFLVSGGEVWAWKTETWMKMPVPLCIGCGILNKPGSRQEWL